MFITADEARRRVAAIRWPSQRKWYEEDFSSPVDWGDENGGYSDPWNPTGYQPF